MNHGVFIFYSGSPRVYVPEIGCPVTGFSGSVLSSGFMEDDVLGNFILIRLPLFLICFTCLTQRVSFYLLMN